jgi:hypothetical protein
MRANRQSSMIVAAACCKLPLAQNKASPDLLAWAVEIAAGVSRNPTLPFHGKIAVKANKPIGGITKSRWPASAKFG